MGSKKDCGIMYLIDEVEIYGFWNDQHIKTKIYKDVNIFIGKNGSGKTTFINTLQATLAVDVGLLLGLPFKKVIIRLKSNSHQRTISVEKEEFEDSSPRLTYSISGKQYPLYLSIRDKRMMMYKHRPPMYTKRQNELRSEIEKLVNISWLSVQREIIPERFSHDFEVEDEFFEINAIEIKIEKLIKEFTEYRLTLERKAVNRSDRFLRDVLITTLFDNDLDKIDFDYILNELDLKRGLKKEEDVLIKAYIDLGVKDDIAKKQVKKHVRMLNKCIKGFREDYEKGHLTTDNITPLPLIKRTQKIIDLSRKAQEDKQLIFEPIIRFLDVIHDFVFDKKFFLSPKGLKFIKNKKSLDIHQLSSGEKQLLIFLISTLLQKRKKFIYIADEPELSLHIEWQKKLIPSIRNLNEKAQIIVATHAPSIATNYSKNLISMEEIING